MALVDNAWYVDFGDGATTGYYAITAWAAGAVIAAGAIRRQLAAPAVGSERVFVCIVAGTTHATTEPTWTTTRGGKTTDNTVTWQECSGIAALNGDATHTPSWTISATPPGGVKGTAVTLGQVIKRDNGASYQICTTAGTAGSGSEPSFSNTAGVTTADNTVTWTSLGVVGNFTGWQAPHARLGNAYASTWGQAGNTFFAASEHAATRAATHQLIPPGTYANPCVTLCVTKTTVPPVSANLTTGASESVTGANTFGLRGVGYYRGVAFNVGSGSASTTPTLQLCPVAGDWCSLENCELNVLGTGTGYGSQTWGYSTPVDAAVVNLKNTTVKQGSVSQTIGIANALITWKDTPSAIQGTPPTGTLFSASGVRAAGSMLIEGVDLSAFAGTTIFGSFAAPYKAVLKDCKIGAAIVGTPGGPGHLDVTVINSDSGATNDREEKYAYTGTQTVERTIIRTGGHATARKIVTTANAKWILPFEAIPIAIYNSTVGSITITLYGIWGGGAVPNNDDIWFEAEYLDDGSSPQGSFATSGKADFLATGSALSSDGSSWGGSTTAFKMAVTITPAQAGPVYLYLKAGRASSTFYVDPKPVVT